MSSVITLSLLIWLVTVQTWGNDLGPLQWFEVGLMRSANSVNEEFGQGVPLFQSVIDRPWQARAEAKYLSFVSLFGSCGWKRPESTSAYQQVHVMVGNSQQGRGLLTVARPMLHLYGSQSLSTVRAIGHMWTDGLSHRSDVRDDWKTSPTCEADGEAEK